MITTSAVAAQIQASGVVAVIRVRDAGTVGRLAEALIAGGITALEVTMTVPGAVQVIERLAADMPGGVMVGAGTVLDVETMRQVVAAGARFVVSPIYVPALVDLGAPLGVTVVPGCYTPTEIHAASERGAEMVKIFPAGSLGPSFIKDLLAPLPGLRVMPTGGVTIANAADWIRAGAVAVGIGSALVDGESLRQGRFDDITDRARRLVDSVAAARGTTGVAGS